MYVNPGLTEPLLKGSTFTIDFSKQFTLHIAVESKLNLPNKKVEITVPDGLTVVEYPIPERGGMAESVTPESIDGLHSVNSYGGYNPTNGTITYSLRSTAEKNSFNIVLAPDTVLWNRSSEQVLKDPLKIRVYTGGADAKTYQTISATPKITGKYNDKEDDNRAIQTGPRLSRVGVKTGVPTAADEPFALRQIWINPDKDYIDMPQFFKKLEITIALPYYTENGSNTYAIFDHITFDPAGQSTRPNLLDPENHDGSNDNYTYTVTPNNTDHTVTLTWENLYLEYGQEYFTPYFKWTSDCDVTTTNAVKWGSNSILNTGKTAPGCYEGKTPTTGAASAVGGTITWQDDRTWYLYNGDCTTFSFTAQAGESMSVNGKANNQPIYNNYTSDSGITYYLGQFHVVNQGGAASAAKTVEFAYGNNDRIGVTAQKIPATTGNTVEVWYTTTKSLGEQKYSGPLTSSGGFVTFTANMAGLGEDEYFTKIKANVGSYEKDYVGYVSSRDQDPTSGYATTFGKLLTADEATYSNFASMKMYDTASGGSTAKSGNYTVKVTNTRGEIPLAMEQAYKEGTLERVPILSKTSATAGDTIAFNGLLSSSAYPYSSNNVTTDQEIYIRLPEKITVENLKLYQEEGRTADKVFLLDAVMETVMKPKRTEIPKNAYKFEAVTSAEEGYKLYKITFTNQDNPAKVGWFTDGLGQYQIGISFDMKIAKNADAMTLDMRDCVRFKSASLKSTSNNGTLAQYQVMDNGARYSTFNVNAKGTKLSVVAARLGLTFTFGARVAGEKDEVSHDPNVYSNFEEKGDKVYLKDSDHVVDMLFTLKNDTGREFGKEDAQAFYYFIPVPKAGDLWDSHMQDHAFEFDMALTGAAELGGASVERGHIQVTYSTTVASNVSAGDPRHYSTVTGNYVTEDKINDWGAVKMIRVAATKDTEKIPEDADLKVNLRLKPAFNENADFVGSEINFGPCGVSPYSVGSTLNQGHNPLPRIQVEFQTGVIAGKIFIDKNFNGTYDEDTDVLYTGSVTVEANHSNGNENCSEGSDAHNTTTQNGTFKFTGRRADTYHVTVANPGSTDANGENQLKFSLPESGGKFSLDAGKNTATASVVLDMNKKPNDINDAGSLQIGFQRPHTVTFSVPNGQGGTTTKVWHGDKLGDVIPTVTADKGYRFTGTWTVGGKTYTAEQLKELAISSDVTFTAEVKQLYSLTYHLNGGSGADAPETSTHIEGEKVRPDYTDTEKLKNGEDTIFVGWSEKQITKPLPEDAAQADIDKIISHDEYIMPAQDVTLYAVYAVDGNGNNNPDYNDYAVHVRYHGNNGDYKDIICPHHHVAGATANLSTNGTVSGKSLGHDKPASAASGEVTSHTFTFTDKTTGNAHIFIGWSTSPILDKVIKTKAEYDNLKRSIKNEVTMLEKPGNDVSDEDAKDTSKYADADGNTNVYAVWAADRNGNNVADYLEEYTLTYDGNAQEGGTVANLPTDADIHIPGDEVTLSSAAPTHDDVDGKKVVFIGWTEAQTNSIFSRADTAPTTITKVTFGSADKTVYAAWGYDGNGNGTADVLETYTLAYDLNGGNETAPAMVSGIAKNTEVTLTAEKNFTRNSNEIFVGWSVTQREDALTAETKQEDLEKFLITGSTYRIGTADVTLYAVWAADSNKNGMADYLEAYATINAVKILEGRDWLESDSFKFKLTALDGAPMPKDDDGEPLDTVTVSGKGAGVGKKAGEKVAFDFGEITYDKAGTYTYEVSEVVPESDADRIPGMAYSGNKATVTVEVTDDTVRGKLVASATVADGTFTNVYKSKLDYNALGGLRIVKKLEGRDISDKQFKFDVAADGADKADTRATGAATMDVRTGVATSTIARALGNLVFTQTDAGKTFNYTVTEQPGSDKGFTYDASKYEVSIGVSDDGRGVLTATTVIKKDGEKVGEYTYKTGGNPATGDDIPTVEFDNSFDAKGSVAIEATKTLKNRPLNTDEFTFQVVDKNGTVVATATNDENGKVDFGPIEYTNARLAEMVREGLAYIERDEDGSLHYFVDYTVREVTDELEHSGVTPVLSSRAVTVEATDDGTPDLSVKIQGNPAIKFTNAYADGIEAPMDLNVKSDIKAADPLKGLELPKMTKGMFQFTLSGAEAEDGTPAPMPEGVEGGTKTVGNDEAGNVDFGTIKYTVENVWPEPAVADDVNGEEGIDGQAASGDERSRTFTYTVIEQTGGAAGIRYDDSVKTIKVTVRDDGQGNLTVTRSDFDSITTFVNTYDVDSVTSIPEISVNKKIDGRDLNKGEFTFELLNKSNKVASTGTNDADGTVTFEAIEFSKPGTYECTLHEAENKLGGVSYDSSFYKVTATVTQDVEAAQLDVAWTVRNLGDEAVENVVFSNAYKAEPTSIQFNGAKQLDGRDIVEGEFEFELVQDGKVIQTVKNAAADESGAAPVSFDAIEFTEPGEFDYEIREIKGSAEGVTYDDEVFTYHVVVTDNGKGNLEAELTAGDNGALVFVNAYEKPASPFDPVLPPDDGDDDDNGGNNGNGGGDNGDDGSGDAGIDAGNGNGDGGSGDTGDGDKLPKTGDTSPIVPLTVVVVLAACVAAVAALRMRRN